MFVWQRKQQLSLYNFPTALQVLFFSCSKVTINCYFCLTNLHKMNFHPRGACSFIWDSCKSDFYNLPVNYYESFANPFSIHHVKDLFFKCIHSGLSLIGWNSCLVTDYLNGKHSSATKWKNGEGFNTRKGYTSYDHSTLGKTKLIFFYSCKNSRNCLLQCLRHVFKDDVHTQCWNCFIKSIFKLRQTFDFDQSFWEQTQLSIGIWTYVYANIWYQAKCTWSTGLTINLIIGSCQFIFLINHGSTVSNLSSNKQ